MATAVQTKLGGALPKIVSGPLPGPKARAIIARREAIVPSAVRCVYPVVPQRGEGAMLEDVDGNLLLDWIGGVGVMNVGYSQPEIIEAVGEQAGRFFHGMANIVTHEGYIEVAERLAAIVPVRGERKRVFLANTGAEANENGVKIARGYTKRPNIIVFSGAFHGRTLLAATMTAKRAYASGLGPFPDGVYRAPFANAYRAPEGLSEAERVEHYIKGLKAVFDEASPAHLTAAIVLEPLQGEGGFVPAPIEWVKALRALCDEHGILLIADEVQTGFGRCGRMFASEYWAEAGAAPDILLSAKSIAGGVPLSAVITREEIMEGIPLGTIGGTYCGNPLACAASLQVMKIMARDELPARGAAIGARVMEALSSWQKEYPVIGDVRGMGGMLGFEFVKDPETKEPFAEIVSAIVQEAVQRGLMLEAAGTYNNVIRFLAPLTITDAQLEIGLAIFKDSIDAALRQLG